MFIKSYLLPLSFLLFNIIPAFTQTATLKKLNSSKLYATENLYLHISADAVFEHSSPSREIEPENVPQADNLLSGSYLPFSILSWDDDKLPPRKGHKNRFIRISIAPAVLMGLGLFTYKDNGLLNRQDFREVWNTLFSDFDDDVNNVAQYYPFAWTYLTKIVGIKGRYSIGRATTAIGIASFIAGSTVWGLKQFIGEDGPDRQFTNVFPSGQTTTAFMGATFMHKELGGISPAYSVVAYTLAAVVGVYRQLNDLHWISDVLFGAGLGIWSVELGYMIADDIYGSQGVNPLPVRSFFDRPMKKPNFITYKLGYSQLVIDVDEIRDLGFNVRSGYSYGNEGAFFFNEWLGVGIEIAMASFPVSIGDYTLPTDNLNTIASDVNSEALGLFSAYFGPYINIPLKSTKVALVFKVAAGIAEAGNGGITISIKDEFQEIFNQNELGVLNYMREDDVNFGASSSLFCRVLVSRVIGVSGFINYNYADPKIIVTQVNDVNPATGAIDSEVIFNDNQVNSFLTVGVSVFGMLWGGTFGN